MKIACIILISLITLSACAGPLSLSYPPKIWLIDKDRAPIKKPAERWAYSYSDDSDVRILYEIEKTIESTTQDAGRAPKSLFTNWQEAMNTSNFDEAPDSAWFTNRIGRFDLDSKTIATGPNTGQGPAKGQWRVIHMRPAEVPPVLFVEDSQGERFEITFDFPGHPQMETGASVIGTLFLHAAGYNVPEGYLVEFDSSALIIDETSASIRRLEKGKPAAEKDLQKLLSQIDQSQGPKRIRAFATKALEGAVVGPFLYHGRRMDDRNDRIPHEHRRELRGLYVFSALLDHVMAFDAHTLDNFVTYPDGEGYLKHYLIRFNDCLGNEKVKENAEIQRLTTSRDTFDSEHFYPTGWQSALPNPAFDNITHIDGFWAAKILARFSDDDISAIVDQAKYSDETTRKFIRNTLIARRDKTIAHWFGNIAPLDNFRLPENGGGVSVVFDNLAIPAGLEKEGSSSYRWRITGSVGRVALSPWRETSLRALEIDFDAIVKMHPGKIYTIQMQTNRADGSKFGPPNDDPLHQRRGGIRCILPLEGGGDPLASSDETRLRAGGEGDHCHPLPSPLPSLRLRSGQAREREWAVIPPQTAGSHRVDIFIRKSHSGKIELLGIERRH